MQASMGQSEKLLPISQHGTCSCAPRHGLGAMESLTEIMVMSLQAYVSAHAEEHSCALLLHGSECVCAYLAVCVCTLGSKCVKARRIWLLTTRFSSALSFSTLFPFVLNYSHHHRSLPPSVGHCVVLVSMHIALFAFIFFPFPSLLMVVCFLFMCGIKRPFEQQLSNLNERGCCLWKIQQKPEQNWY